MIASLLVLCIPPTNTVSGGMVSSRVLRRSRTRGSFRICAIARPFGPPRDPPQAPQSWADSWGLFMLLEPWPNISTSREKPDVSPVSRNTRSAMSVISSREKPTRPFSGPGVGSSRSSRSRVSRGVWTNRLSLRRSRAVKPREEGPGDQRDRGEHAASSRQDCPQREAPAADVEPVRQQSQGSPSPRAALVRLLGALDDFLDDPVLGAHDGRAEGYEVRVGRSPVVHRDEVEPGDAERDRVRGHFFEMTAQRLLAFVDAENRLKARRGRHRAAACGCAG